MPGACFAALISMMSKTLLAAAAGAAIAAASLPVAHAANPWPAAKPITLIVPFSAGGNVDFQARLIGQKLGERLGQSVIVDNVPGAGGVLGVAKAINAKPDGYTIVIGFDGPVSVAQLVNKAVKYDAERDLAPIGQVSVAPVVLMARPGLPAKNMAELIALAKAQPGKISYGTSGVGTVLHLAMEMVQERAKVQMVHVPYRGGAQISNDVMGGQVDTGYLVTTSATPLVQQGKLQALGVTSAQRIDSIPQVPAFAETPALKGLEINTWTGLFAPKNTPALVVTRLATELAAVLQQPEVRQRLKDGGATPGTGTPATFAAFLKKEKAAYAAIVRSAKIEQE
jgi:tripartite-type tricarboxylate transporter receptor subunit TctC